VIVERDAKSRMRVALSRPLNSRANPQKSCFKRPHYPRAMSQWLWTASGEQSRKASNAVHITPPPNPPLE
jgi:hypothetical protein